MRRDLIEIIGQLPLQCHQFHMKRIRVIMTAENSFRILDAPHLIHLCRRHRQGVLRASSLEHHAYLHHGLAFIAHIRIVARIARRDYHLFGACINRQHGIDHVAAPGHCVFPGCIRAVLTGSGKVAPVAPRYVEITVPQRLFIVKPITVIQVRSLDHLVGRLHKRQKTVPRIFRAETAGLVHIAVIVQPVLRVQLIIPRYIRRPVIGYYVRPDLLDLSAASIYSYWQIRGMIIQIRDIKRIGQMYALGIVILYVPVGIIAVAVKPQSQLIVVIAFAVIIVRHILAEHESELDRTFRHIVVIVRLIVSGHLNISAVWLAVLGFLIHPFPRPVGIEQLIAVFIHLIVACFGKIHLSVGVGVLILHHAGPLHILIKRQAIGLLVVIIHLFPLMLVCGEMRVLHHHRPVMEILTPAIHQHVAGLCKPEPARHFVPTVVRRLSHTAVMSQIASVGYVVDPRFLDVDIHIVAQAGPVEINRQLRHGPAYPRMQQTHARAYLHHVVGLEIHAARVSFLRREITQHLAVAAHAV